MVIHELQHRTKNLFAVFQAIASRSLEDGKTPAEIRTLLNGRVRALSDAYDALANSGSDGAPLSEVIKRQLAGFSSRVAISGCDIIVGPSSAQQFALMVHELATNATKYGALSNAQGLVSIEGKSDRLAGVFSFRWHETGGPPVAKPTRKGFGSVIIQDAAKSLARSVSVEFDPLGLKYELHIDLSALELSGTKVLEPVTAPPQLVAS
ncbi:HWE histidine kinase domain-containing protein [Mesorhizobium sp.]|uniref:HWE histidine kinase domain-containing protein n=1 Tax=Mesorhizobium sp. TaxID=1871066 RepID=UPI000FE94B3A|nr:MAG: hypothetical protein EOS56_00745 [Mesorhizobium sp.]RWC67116.1 MAG: hypothetical protein EOS29_01575 [Mesorhizobium sp.]TIW93716.1 MAG: hypothetical protein E5V59_14810 [Mesorhizobium sp.]